MEKIKRICICGGGGLGHTCAAVLSSHDDVEVMLYTQHPERWNKTFVVDDCENKIYNGRIVSITNKPEEVVPFADLVLLCLPAFLVEKTLIEIQPLLSSRTIVGSIVGNTGFFLFAHKILDVTTKLFAFQRVPYISRVVEYGKKASLLGYKKELLVAAENIDNPELFSEEIGRLFLTPTYLLDSFYEVTLSNSNPILHTGRIYSMWKDWRGECYSENPLFYHDWTDEASEILLKMDEEFFELLKFLNVNTKHLLTLLQHYEVSDAFTLTAKLKSISSFSTIKSPMKQVSNGWVPDLTSRYFTEDFNYGLRFIYELAHQNNISCPTIDKVYEWGVSLINKSL